MSSQLSRLFSENEILLTEGETGDCAYLIESGKVLIYLNKDGKELPLQILGEGDVIGEMSLIDSSPRSASCRALTPGRMIVVTKDQLLERIRQTDPVVKLLLQAFLDRIRSQNNRILGRTSKENIASLHSFSKQHQEALDQISLTNRLAKGLENNEFLPYFQPIFNLKNKELIGCEALMRWQTPDQGLIKPDKFMDTMEESALILPAGKMMIEKSIAFLPEMLNQFSASEEFFVSINIGSSQFTEIGFFDHLDKVRKQYGLQAKNIKLELTERIMLAGPLAITQLQTCREHGYKLAIDDFGTGFSSLQYLAQMPLTDLKIDRSFIMKMLTDDKSMSIIKSLIYLANHLNLNLIAEGIESRAELEMLRKLKVPMGQGFYFAKALPANEFIKLAPSFRLKAA